MFSQMDDMVSLNKHTSLFPTIVSTDVREKDVTSYTVPNKTNPTKAAHVDIILIVVIVSVLTARWQHRVQSTRLRGFDFDEEDYLGRLLSYSTAFTPPLLPPLPPLQPLLPPLPQPSLHLLPPLPSCAEHPVPILAWQSCPPLQVQTCPCQ